MFSCLFKVPNTIKSKSRSFLGVATAMAGLYVCVPVMAEPVKPPLSPEMSLKQAVRTGLFSNPSYKEAQNNEMASRKRVRQARAGYFPNIDLQGDGGYESTKNSATQDGNVELFRRRISIDVRQLVFDGFETKYEVERQKGRAKAATFDLYEESEQTTFDIITAYISVALQRDLLRIAGKNVAKHEQILSDVRQSTEAGRTSRVDVDQVSARLASARSDLSSIQQNLQDARSDFKRLTGRFPGKLISLKDISSGFERSLDDHLASVLKNSPALNSAKADMRAAHAEYKQTMAPFLPQINFELSAQEAEDIGGVEGIDRTASAGTSLNWNLYRGGEDAARRKEFEYRLAEAQAIQARLAREVEDEVRKTWAAMKAAGEREANFRIQADANEKLVAAYLQQFNLNRRTLLDVLDVQSELFRSQSNAVSEKSEKLISEYRLLALEGSLLEHFGISRNDIAPMVAGK